MGLFSRSGGSDTPAPPIEELVPGTGALRCRFKTSKGEMVADLYEAEAPRTVANFVALALGKVEWTDPKGQTTSAPLYSGTIFHRVIKDFMIQGGDPEGSGRGGPGWRFADEISAKHKHTGKGVLSMANAGPNTNGSQFFICEVATPWLDGKHAVFGQVTEGHDVIDAITSAPKGAGDRPIEDIVLHEIEVFRA